jgi:hypothetical protein
MAKSQGNERKLAGAYWRVCLRPAYPLQRKEASQRQALLFRITNIRSFAFPDGMFGGEDV